MYETFEHTADLGLRVRATDLETLFADAARGLMSMMVPDLDSVRPIQEVTFQLEAANEDLLLFDWLSELLYVYETRRVLLVNFSVELTAQGMRATATGEPIDRQRHLLDHEVKAITYHGLKVERVGGGWIAEVIVDI